MIKSKNKLCNDYYNPTSRDTISRQVKANWSKLLLPGLLIVLTSCNPGRKNGIESGAPVDNQDLVKIEEKENKTEQPTQQLFAPNSPTLTISAKGIGEARLGMKFGELKQKLVGKGQLSESQPFMVGFHGIAVSKNGEVQYYILHSSSEPLTDETPIKFLLTENPNFRTAEGVAPNMSISQAESAYGEAKLGYNTEVESREYIYFAQHPAQNIQFRSNGNTEKFAGFAGVYSGSSQGNYYETADFRDRAAIGSIMVSSRE